MTIKSISMVVDYADTMHIIKLLKLYIPDLETANQIVANKFKEIFDCKAADEFKYVDRYLDKMFDSGVLKIMYNGDILAYFYKKDEKRRLVAVSENIEKYRKEFTNIFSVYCTNATVNVIDSNADEILKELLKEYHGDNE